jgi:dihydrofolate reductase
MAKVLAEVSVSLDGFIAGPKRTVEQPLGEGGELLHEWIVRLASWREQHGGEGGETGVDDELVRERVAATGAYVMGRRMFSGGEGPWEDDPVADGWWGDDPPFGAPVFVLTSHPRETVQKRGGTSYTFITAGVEEALDRARAAAGDKDVVVAGGARTIQEVLGVGLLDELQLHLVPVLLGDGVRLFAGDGGGVRLEVARVVESTGVTHLVYRVVK